MTEEVEVGKNSEICLTEMDKDGDVQDGVWVEIAQINSLELQQIPQERMNRNSQSVLEVILKNYSFVGMRHWVGLTSGWPPSDSDTVW